MSGNEGRLIKLENIVNSGGRVSIGVDWEGDGMVVDQATGERVTIAEWERRHPEGTLIIIDWEDSLVEDDEDSELMTP